MPVYIPQNNDKPLMYYVAKKFVHLTWSEKFQIGRDMKILSPFDAALNEDELEYKVFLSVVQNKNMPQFMIKCQRIRAIK